MPERNKADLIDAFAMNLGSVREAKLRQVADYRHVCAGAEFDTANSCEVIADIRALRRLGLLREFTGFACAEVRCTEPAVCEKPATDRRRAVIRGG
jgi:hypothetical protein